MVIAPFAKLAVGALPKLAAGAAAVGNAVFTGGKLPGGMFTTEALKYMAVLPVLGIGARALGLPIGTGGGGAPPPAAGPVGGMGMGAMSPHQFERLYGRQNYQLGPFELPFGAQEGYLEKQARETRALQRELGLGMQGTQRYGIDAHRDIAGSGYRTQENIARMTTNTQRDLTRMMTDTQRALGFAGNQTQYGIADMSTRRQLAGIYGGFERDVAIADRNLAGLYDTNRTQSRVASMQTNLGRYQADRGVEATRISSIAPRLAAIAGVFSRRY